MDHGTPRTAVSAPAPSRRAVLGAAGAAAVTLPLVVGRSPVAAAPLSLAARPADDVVDSFGVVIHTSWRDSVYGETHRVQEWLEKLGARHVRTRIVNADDTLDAFRQLSRSGIQVNAVFGELGNDRPSETAMSLMRAIDRHYPHPGPVFSTFENINEPNNKGVRWVRETRRRARELHEARRRFELGYIPIAAPALARVNSGGVEGRTTERQARRLGDLSDVVDLGNMHVYSRALPPSDQIPRFRKAARVVAGQGPVICTEGGYFTALDYEGGSLPVPMGVAAAYGPQSVLTHMKFGTPRFFRYELLDEPVGSSWDKEAAYGLIHTRGGDWRPKPEFRAMQQMLRMFRDRGSAFEPDPLRIAFRDAPGGMRHAVFQKRDGTHLLCLWLERPIWNPVRERLTVPDLDSTMNTVRIKLDQKRAVRVRRFDGSVSDKGTLDAARIPLKPGVTVVELGPA